MYQFVQKINVWNYVVEDVYVHFVEVACNNMHASCHNYIVTNQ